MNPSSGDGNHHRRSNNSDPSSHDNGSASHNTNYIQSSDSIRVVKSSGEGGGGGRGASRPSPPAAPSIVPRDSHAEGAASAVEALERKKNQIVHEMLVKIKPFVGPSGGIQPDADFNRLATVMGGEADFLGRTLLLTVLVSSTQMPPERASDEAKALVFLLCDRLAKNGPVLAVLQKWLLDGAKGSEPAVHLVGKILEILGRLHLSVDQLVEYKFGKVIKKLAAAADDSGISEEVWRKAKRLFEEWSSLAKAEDVRRRSSSDTSPVMSPLGGAEGTERKRSLHETNAAGGAVENLDLFSEGASAAPVAKTRAAMILERAAAAHSTAAAAKPAATTTNRPLSADDIHKAKRRKQYLQEAVASGQANADDLESLGINLEDLARPEAAGDECVAGAATPRPEAAVVAPKKRVSFAHDDALVQVRYIEPVDDEYYGPEEGAGGARRGSGKPKKKDYHHADREEAAYAFRRRRMEMEAEIGWQEPRAIEMRVGEEAVPARGSESTEREAQTQRERRQVSAVYFTLEHVPPSPSEAHVAAETEPSQPAKSIPESAPGLPVQKVAVPLPGRAPPAAAGAVPSVDVLSALLNSSKMMQHLGPQPPMLPPLPGFPFGPGLAQRPPAAPLPAFPFPLPSQPSSAPVLRPPLSFPFPPPPLPPQAPAMPPFPFGRPPPPPPGFQAPTGFPAMAVPRPPCPAPPGVLPQNMAKLKTKPCKYYKPGQPGSCRFGDSCNFLHQDSPR